MRASPWATRARPARSAGRSSREDAFDRQQAALERARSEGGSVSGGERVLAEEHPDAFYVRPALVRMPAQTGVVRDETFAPILYALTYGDLDEAIALHNGVPQGLSSCIFTTDLREAERFLSAAGSDCGIANVNIGPSGAEIGGAFGGEKDTGRRPRVGLGLVAGLHAPPDGHDQRLERAAARSGHRLRRRLTRREQRRQAPRASAHLELVERALEVMLDRAGREHERRGGAATEAPPASASATLELVRRQAVDRALLVRLRGRGRRARARSSPGPPRARRRARRTAARAARSGASAASVRERSRNRRPSQSSVRARSKGPVSCSPISSARRRLASPSSSRMPRQRADAAAAAEGRPARAACALEEREQTTGVTGTARAGLGLDEVGEPVREDPGIAPAACEARVANALEMRDRLPVAPLPELEQAERRADAVDGRPHSETLGEVERVLGARAAVLIASLYRVQPGEAAQGEPVIGSLACLGREPACLVQARMRLRPATRVEVDVGAAHERVRQQASAYRSPVPAR